VEVVLDVQLNQATVPWPALRERAMAADEAGYGTLWAFDHLAGESVGGASMLDAFTLLGALATSTTAAGLGVLVANVNNRTPAALAVAAASVQAIAGRPFHLGLGAGGAPESRWSAEMHAVGQPVVGSLPERHRLVERALDTLELLWSPDRPAEVATFPLPHPRPPVIIGVNGPELATVAGRRADGVNVSWRHPRRDELLQIAAAAAATAGRTAFELSTFLRWSAALLDPSDPTRLEMAGRGIARAVLVVPAEVTTDELARHPVR
jgi:alkanesulfonate monooxygenase SsuD/methylene tetrahydromethanopterin reductase-like flavin-dependent oxidoreductase (luciferase family)